MKSPITSAQAMSHLTVVEVVNALAAIADEHRELVSMLVCELRYIEGIGNEQVQQAVKKALAKLPDNAEVTGACKQAPVDREVMPLDTTERRA